NKLFGLNWLRVLPTPTYNHYLGGDGAEVLKTGRIRQGDSTTDLGGDGAEVLETGRRIRQRDSDGGDSCQKSRWNGQQQWRDVMQTDEKQCQNESRQ
ncbi:hypothetical protein A2U01_0022100, partial [Trifolium medium]|nr:hypothetical protein [Trifolium medium]